MNLVQLYTVKVNNTRSKLIVIGGGLAGAEAAWQAAIRGIEVDLYEMRPKVQTGAHQSDQLAELVCSNSLGSNLPDRASGVLKNELRALNSMLMRCADETAVPAGGALAVDRELFAQKVTDELKHNPKIKIIRKEMTGVPKEATIIASGPLTSPKLSEAIQELTGYEHIFFYDAIAPIIYKDSIDLEIAYQASRYGKESDGSDGDYINCPLNKEQYYKFVDALIRAERIELKEFENNIHEGVLGGAVKFFEGCLPIEIIAKRGIDALAYGPMRPVGLTDKRTGKHSYAVVQLRQDNLAKTLYNLVGFQTNLKFSEQKRIIRMIPGLEKVEFARYGQMHRNTFIFSPALLKETLQYKYRDDLFFAGQITGVEGYLGNVATGLLAGWNAANYILGKPLLQIPTGTIIGALCSYITHTEARDFQPMKANFGILPDLDRKIRGKRDRAAAFAARSNLQLTAFLRDNRDK